MKILVIGGTLFIGRHVVARLLDQDHEVWVLHRKERHDLGERVGNLTADRNDTAALTALLKDHRFDAVFDNVYDWERGTTAEQVEACARAVEGVRRYIFMSSVAAYGEGLDNREESELAPFDHPEPYIRNKAESERVLFRLHRETGFPVVTLRPPFIYGPFNPIYREAFFWDRLREGRPVILPEGGRSLMQFAYVHDLVQVCLQVLENPAAVGEAFNVAHPEPITQAELVRSLGEAAGLPVRTVSVPRKVIQEAGGHPMGPKLYFGVYYDMPSITLRVEKARRVLGFEPSDFLQALRTTYDWYRSEYRGPKSDYAFEDELISLAGYAPPPRGE